MGVQRQDGGSSENHLCDKPHPQGSEPSYEKVLTFHLRSQLDLILFG